MGDDDGRVPKTETERQRGDRLNTEARTWMRVGFGPNELCIFEQERDGHRYMIVVPRIMLGGPKA